MSQAGEDIVIMIGSGVNESNLQDLMKKSKALEFHSSARCFRNSAMQYTNPNIDMGGQQDSDEYKIISVNVESIRKMAAILKQAG